MTIRPIVVLGHPVLRTPARAVTEFDDQLKQLVQDMLDTVRRPGRAGLAAPQIGVDLRIFTYNVGRKIGHVINPEIVSLSDEQQTGEEGCLSVPDLWFPTTRAMRATVRGVNYDGAPVELSGSGMMARCLQHEVDHLDGMLYLDRLTGDQRKRAMRAVRETDWAQTSLV